MAFTPLHHTEQRLTRAWAFLGFSIDPTASDETGASHSCGCGHGVVGFQATTAAPAAAPAATAAA